MRPFCNGLTSVMQMVDLDKRQNRERIARTTSY